MLQSELCGVRNRFARVRRDGGDVEKFDHGHGQEGEQKKRSSELGA